MNIIRLSITLALLISLATSAACADADSVRTPTYDTLIDQLRSRTDRNLSLEATSVDASYRDSVTASFDADVRRSGLAAALDRHRDGPRRAWRSGFSYDPQEIVFDYTKVDAVALAAPVYWRVVGPLGSLQAGGTLGYSFGTKSGRFRQGIRYRNGDLSLFVTARRLTATFGWTKVHGSRFFALAGADEQHYLERRGLITGLDVSLSPSTSARLSYAADEDRPLRARDVFTVSDEDGLSALNRRATAGDRRAVEVRVVRDELESTRFFGSLSLESAGRGLGGHFDYDRIGLDVTRRTIIPGGDEVRLRVRGQMVAGPGELPLQTFAEGGGRSGVRGYPQSALFGSHALLARLDYEIERDLFAAARVPILRNLRLQIVPFADVGAAWTPAVNRELGDATLPSSSEWKWGAGVGIRKNVGFGHLLSHLRLDTAWRLDRPSPGVVYFVLEGEPFE